MKQMMTVETLEARIAPAIFLPTIRPGAVWGAIDFEIAGPDQEIHSVKNIGDFNGDGLPDLAIAGAGTVYVVYGNPNGYPDLLNLGSLNGTDGFSISGLDAGDRFGFSLDGGDINGDGRSDLAIGAPGVDHSGGRINSGAAYVIFGAQSTEATLFLSSLTGTTGFEIAGSAENQAFGTSIVIGGSVNGDAFGDLVVGGPGLTPPSGPAYQGIAAVIFGKASGFANLDGFASLTGTNGFTVAGTPGSRLGTAVNILGDINGDGIGEINLGTSADGILPLNIDGAEQDIGYILFGKNTWSATYSIDQFALPETIAIQDMRGAEIGSYFRTQDVNGDGTNDLVGFAGFFRGGKLFIGGVVAPRTGSDMPSGSYYPEEWKTQGVFDSVSLNLVSRAIYIDGGDFNGDGFLDMVVDGDVSSLIFGTALKGNHFVGKKDAGLTFAGLSQKDGQRVQFIGDINGDGYDDLAVQYQVEWDVESPEQVSIILGSSLQLSRDGKTATWTGVDGDLVKLKTTKGHLDYARLLFAKLEPGSAGRTLDFFFPDDAGSVIVTVKQNLQTGDGMVRIGEIYNAGLALGTVSIDGHLGRMVSGYRLGSLVVDSLGRMPDGSLADTSVFDGKVGTIRIKGEVAAGLTVVGKAGSLKTGVIADGVTITSLQNMGLLQAASIGSATLTLESLNKLVVKGDKASGLSGNFNATLTLGNGGSPSDRPVLGSVMIAGLVKGATFDVSGSIGKFTAGAMENSKIFAGFHADSPENPFGGGIFLTAAAIKRLVITGSAAPATSSGVSFASSTIIAAAIGRVTIPSADETNGGSAFGIGFRDSVGSIVLNQPSFSYDKETGGSQGTGDFKVLEL